MRVISLGLRYLWLRVKLWPESVIDRLRLWRWHRQRWTQEELDAARKRADELAPLFGIGEVEEDRPA